MRPLGGLKGCSRLVKGSAGVAGGGRNGWKMIEKIENSNIPHNGEFWGNGDIAGSKEHQILHYIVKSRLPENSARSINEKLRFWMTSEGPEALPEREAAGAGGRSRCVKSVKKFPSNHRLGILIYIPRVVLMHIGGGHDFEKSDFFLH